MPSKAQHALRYRMLPALLRSMREKAGLTQRELGKLLDKPQSWVFNCETANRRVDLAEFVTWCEACGVKPQNGLKRFLKS
ncbi:MAG: helix-turn-helix domain-containing protein [Planctomycetota bacterium]